MSKAPNGKPGTTGEKPDGGFFFVDPNQAGNAQDPRVTRVAVGRLVEVFGFDANAARVPMAARFVVRADLVSDHSDYVLETNAATARQDLLILRDVSDTAPGGGREQFLALLAQAEAGLSPVHDLPFGQSGLFSMIPRNAAVVVQFDDLVDAQTVRPDTLRVLVGNPPVLPFEGRLFVDPNHGDLAEHDGADGLEFYSTRVILDPTVTEVESFESDPPLAVNGLGLPPAPDANLSNFELRIPTRIDAAYGQHHLLENPSGHALTTSGNGTVDHGSPTRDVVRAARSGGPAEATADPYNGFLRDDEAPTVVGVHPVFVAAAPVPLDDHDEFLLPSTRFESSGCAHLPRAGDVLRQLGVYAEVLAVDGPLEVDVVRDLRVRLLRWPAIWDAAGGSGPLEWTTNAVGAADLLAEFDAVEDAPRAACFVGVFPRPTDFAQDPASGLYTGSSFTVRFSEPMDPVTVTAFDSFTVTRAALPASTSDWVVGGIVHDAELQEFTHAPDLPLAHLEGEAERYWLRLVLGTLGSTDLAGNGLAGAPEPIALRLEPAQPTERNGGRVTRFSSYDEEPPFDEGAGPNPEWTGQHFYDLAAERLRPRPVTRFRGHADRSQAIVQIMPRFPQGLQTPLSGLGSRMQTVWRYVDMGMGLTDLSQHDIDVEGLYWSPAEGNVVAETFQEFQMSLAHSAWLPDEVKAASSALPQWPDSGLVDKFTKNVLDKKDDPLTVVHPKSRGYSIRPGDVEVSATGTTLVPWPMNRDVSPAEWVTWTWRNTAVRKRDGEKGAGADPDAFYGALGITPPCNRYYAAGNIRTIGLPMLMEFRCYPDDGAFGINPLDVSFAINSSNQPTFRAWATGGYDASGTKHEVDPDTQELASGGYNPTSQPPGAELPGRDNTFYVGAADFVVRVSRSYSIWFDALDPASGAPFLNPVYVEPVMEPDPNDQPDGTNVRLAFRGMVAFVPEPSTCPPFAPNLDPLEDASTLDSYGDHYDDLCLPPDQPTCSYVPNHNPPRENRGMIFLNDDEWRDSITEIDTASYYQTRITFESNVQTGLAPSLAALAVSWYE